MQKAFTEQISSVYARANIGRYDMLGYAQSLECGTACMFFEFFYAPKTYLSVCFLGFEVVLCRATENTVQGFGFVRDFVHKPETLGSFLDSTAGKHFKI